MLHLYPIFYGEMDYKYRFNFLFLQFSRTMWIIEKSDIGLFCLSEQVEDLLLLFGYSSRAGR